MKLQCSDPSCGHETRQLLFRRRVCCTNPGAKVRGRVAHAHVVDPCGLQCNNRVDPLHSAGQLYNQLIYYRSLFDIDAVDTRLTSALPPPHVDMFKRLYAHVEKHIAQSAYHNVSLKSLFSFYAEQHDETTV